MDDWRDRLRLIAVTATLTSIAWILFGAVLYTRQVSPPRPTTRAAPASPFGPIAKAGPSGLIIPVQGVAADQLVDTWGQARAGGARRHEAIDIMAPRGTPVIAASAGTVEKLFVSEQGGITVYVRTPDRRAVHYYAHLDRYADGLSEGQAVRAGQVIGYVGTTGSASPEGPHLHFAIEQLRADQSWWEGRAVNPYPLLRGR